MAEKPWPAEIAIGCSQAMSPLEGRLALRFHINVNPDPVGLRRKAGKSLKTGDFCVLNADDTRRG
jgi:hypothetical protein